MTESNMTNDDKYIALMSKYKRERGRLGPGANKYLDAAAKLMNSGKVSEDAIIAAAAL